MKNKSLARILGNGFAHIQDGIDRLVNYGFEQLNNMESTPHKSDSQGKRLLKNVSGFLGTLGTTYYATYDRIKREHATKAEAPKPPVKSQKRRAASQRTSKSKA